MAKQLVALSIIIIMLVVSVPTNSQVQDAMDLSISGSVIDNYANITYWLTVSPETEDFSITIPRQEGLFLSNATLWNSNTTLWGRVREASEAEQIYNETVKANQIGMLIAPMANSYYISINNPASEPLNVGLFVEGILTRQLGRYPLSLLPGGYQFRLDMELEITSSVSTVLAIEVQGLEGQTLSRMGNGFKLSVEDALTFDAVQIDYVLSDYDLSASMITYSDGTYGFFNFFLAPKLELGDTPSTRQIIFTLDVSGSMSGERLDQAKLALTEIIETLGPNDQFNLVTFSAEASTMWTEIRPATEQNKEEAVSYIQSLNAQSSTNIYDAITISLAQFFESDAEKLMIMISDGVPTAGVTDPDTIREHARESNTLGVNISTIAIGESGVESLLEGIALDNNGIFVLVRNDGDIGDVISSLFSTLYVPSIDQISFSFSAGVLVDSLNINLTSGFLSLSNGSEIVVSGKFAEQVISVTANYRIGNETFQVSKNASIAAGGKPYAEKLWVLQRILYLVGLETLTGSDAFKQEIISLGIQYGLLVEGYTSMILSALAEEDSSTESQFTKVETAFDNPNIVTRLPGTYVDATPLPLFGILFAPIIIIWIRRKIWSS